MERKTQDLPTPVLLLIAPTRFIFDMKFMRSRVQINSWSWFFLVLNVVFLFALPILKELPPLLHALPFFVWALPFSRVIEIAYAFYFDSLEQMEGRTAKSGIKRVQRFKLLGRSYIEVAVCYASLYLALPVISFEHAPTTSFESLYFSWITITTTGFGDITPKTVLARSLCMTEVAIGLMLLVFAVGTYFSYKEGGPPTPEPTSNKAGLTFGYPEEWEDFGARNPLFLERFPHLERALKIAFHRDASLQEPIDKFILMFGRLCLEDFFEILLCCGNGYGHAAQKLLRGLYERAVTLRYLHEHPQEVGNFLDYYHVAQRKLKLACEATMGADTFPPDQAAQIEREYAEVKEKYMVTDCEKCGTKRLNHTWSKLDFVAMANQTSLGKLNAIGYMIPLRHAHATVASMVSRMKSTESDGISFADEPQRAEADKALRAAHNVFLDTLRVQDERFRIPGLKEQNEVCLHDFMDIWQK